MMFYLLKLQSGKQCLCRFKLSSLGKDQILHDPKIVGLADAVEERINVIVNSGRVWLLTVFSFCYLRLK